jgi:hypothetical protein
MGKMIRILVALTVILSFVLIARNQAAWAANPGADSSASQSTVNSHGNRHCSPHDKSDRKHDGDDCDDDDDDDGTVKPPRHRAKSCKLGTFSVGGVATIQIKRLGRGDCVSAFTEPYDPHRYPSLPPGKSAASPVVSVKLPKKGALVKVCMAAPPGKKVGMYKIDKGHWVGVGSVSKGKACTETSKSGTYILLR